MYFGSENFFVFCSSDFDNFFGIDNVIFLVYNKRKNFGVFDMLVENEYGIVIYPNRQQKVFINKTFDCYKFVYNYWLKRKEDTYKQNGKSLNLYDCCKELTSLKRDSKYQYLQDVDSIALQQALIELDNDFQRFFKSPKKENYPHSKENCDYYKTVFKQNNIYLTNKYIKLPKMERIDIEEETVPYLPIQEVTVSKDKNMYYAYILFEES